MEEPKPILEDWQKIILNQIEEKEKQDNEKRD